MSIKEYMQSYKDQVNDFKKLSYEERKDPKGKEIVANIRAIREEFKKINAEIREDQKRHVGNYKPWFEDLIKFFKRAKKTTNYKDNTKRGGGNPFFKRK